MDEQDRGFESEEQDTEAHLKRSGRETEEPKDELADEDDDLELHAKQPPTAL